MDKVYSETGGSNGGTIRPAIFNVAGVQYTVLFAVLMAATFLPRGACHWNPKSVEAESGREEVEMLEGREQNGQRQAEAEDGGGVEEAGGNRGEKRVVEG